MPTLERQPASPQGEISKQFKQHESETPQMAKPGIPDRKPDKREVPEIPNPIPERMPALPREPVQIPIIVPRIPTAPVPVRR